MLPDTASLYRLAAVNSVPLLRAPTPVEELQRLREALGTRARILVKRDDAIPFGFGGNKVRKLALVAAEALASGADTLVTMGGAQSNHARATAAVAARLGVRCVVIANGPAPEPLRANALLNRLLGAEVIWVPGRAERVPMMEQTVARLVAEGRTPYAIHLGASVPLGALAYARAVGELIEQGVVPTIIVHACSSGGTQAGIVAGCRLNGIETRVIGVSADDPAASVRATTAEIVRGVGALLETPSLEEVTGADIEVDDSFAGPGYGIPSPQSEEAQRLAARAEALFVDHTYTAKALAALCHYAREGRFDRRDTVIFWHTGGQVGLFA